MAELGEPGIGFKNPRKDVVPQAKRPGEKKPRKAASAKRRLGIAMLGAKKIWARSAGSRKTSEGSARGRKTGKESAGILVCLLDSFCFGYYYCSLLALLFSLQLPKIFPKIFISFLSSSIIILAFSILVLLP